LESVVFFWFISKIVGFFLKKKGNQVNKLLRSYPISMKFLKIS